MTKRAAKSAPIDVSNEPRAGAALHPPEPSGEPLGAGLSLAGRFFAGACASASGGGAPPSSSVGDWLH